MVHRVLTRKTKRGVHRRPGAPSPQRIVLLTREGETCSFEVRARGNDGVGLSGLLHGQRDIPTVVPEALSFPFVLWWPSGRTKPPRVLLSPTHPVLRVARCH